MNIQGILHQSASTALYYYRKEKNSGIFCGSSKFLHGYSVFLRLTKERNKNKNKNNNSSNLDPVKSGGIFLRVYFWESSYSFLSPKK